MTNIHSNPTPLRVAITNGRLRSPDPTARTLTFTYKNYADASRTKALTLSGVEFIRRLRLHLLPRGFTKIRHYGLLGNNRRHRCVPQARAALATSPLRFAPRPAPRLAPPRVRSPARIARAPTCAASDASNAPAKSASLPAPGSPARLPLTPIPHEPSAQ